jgi:hypothetical protein
MSVEPLMAPQGTVIRVQVEPGVPMTLQPGWV